jgi:L-asparaginase
VGVAVGAVLSLPDGVYIAMNGRIFDPFKCRKNRDKRMFEEV